MDKDQKDKLKKIVTRNYLQGFILASLFSLGIMIAGFNKIYWGYLALIIGIWALFCGVLGITTYFYQKSHPQLNKIIMQPEIQKSFGLYLMFFGIALILVSIYQFIFIISGEGKRIVLVVGGFGLLTFLWGYLDYIRERKKTK